MSEFRLKLTLEADDKGGQRLVGTLKQIGTQAGKTDRKVRASEKALRKFARSGTRTSRELLTLRRVLFAFTTGALGAFIKSTVTAAAKMENINLVLTQVKGSTAAAGREFAFVKDLALKLGLDIETAAFQYARLSAATKEAGMSSDQTRKLFVSVSTAMRAMGADSRRVSLGLLAIEQMASKGRVSMEELRRQLGESLVGAMQIAAKSMGKTTAEFTKLVETGKVMSDEFLPRFADQLDRQFGDKVEDIGKLASTAFGQFKSAIFLAKKEVGEGLIPVVKDLVKEVTEWTDANKELLKEFGIKLGESLRTVIALGKKLIENWSTIKKILLVIIGIKVAQWFANIGVHAIDTVKAVSGAVTSFKAFTAGAGKAAVAARVFTSALLGPAGLVAALVALLGVLIKIKLDRIRKDLDEAMAASIASSGQIEDLTNKYRELAKAIESGQPIRVVGSLERFSQAMGELQNKLESMRGTAAENTQEFRDLEVVSKLLAKKFELIRDKANEMFKIGMDQKKLNAWNAEVREAVQELKELKEALDFQLDIDEFIPSGKVKTRAEKMAEEFKEEFESSLHDIDFSALEDLGPIPGAENIKKGWDEFVAKGKQGIDVLGANFGAMFSNVVSNFLNDLIEGNKRFGDALADAFEQAGEVAGATIGMTVGGPMGEAVGGALGKAVGKAVGGLFRDKQSPFAAFDIAIQEGQAVLGRITQAKMNLQEIESQANDLIREINDLFKDIGGTVESFANLTLFQKEGQFEVRNNLGQTIARFGEDVNAAIDFFILEVIKSAEITGISEDVLNAIKQAAEEAGGSLDVFKEDLAIIQEIDKLNRGITGVAEAADEAFKKFNELAEAARRFGLSMAGAAQQLEDSLRGIRGGILGRARGLAGRDQGVRSQFGDMITDFAELKNQAREFNQQLNIQIDMKKAELQATKAEIDMLVTRIEVLATLQEAGTSFLNEVFFPMLEGFGVRPEGGAFAGTDPDTLRAQAEALREQAASLEQLIEMLESMRINVGRIAGLQGQALDNLQTQFFDQLEDFLGLTSPLDKLNSEISLFQQGLRDLFEMGRITRQEFEEWTKRLQDFGQQTQLNMQREAFGGALTLLAKWAEAAGEARAAAEIRWNLEIQMARVQAEQLRLQLIALGMETQIIDDTLFWIDQVEALGFQWEEVAEETTEAANAISTAADAWSRVGDIGSDIVSQIQSLQQELAASTPSPFDDIFTDLDNLARQIKGLFAARVGGTGIGDIIEKQIRQATGIQNLEGVLDLIEKVRQARIDKLLEDIFQPIIDFRNSVKLSDVSPLTPRQKLAEAQRQFDELAAKAFAGDVSAIRALPAAARRLLEEGRSFFASSTGFQNIFQQVDQIMQALLAAGGNLFEGAPNGTGGLGAISSILGGAEGTENTAATIMFADQNHLDLVALGAKIDKNTQEVSKVNTNVTKSSSLTSFGGKAPNHTQPLSFASGYLWSG